jgi:hypothetical protein
MMNLQSTGATVNTEHCSTIDTEVPGIYLSRRNKKISMIDNDKLIGPAWLHPAFFTDRGEEEMNRVGV